jgi:hypothetical protein
VQEECEDVEVEAQIVVDTPEDSGGGTSLRSVGEVTRINSQK